MKEKLLKIINHYGIDKQLKYIHTEYFELDKAILQHREISFNSEGDLGDIFALKRATDHIIEELADVMVMLEQFRLYYNIPSIQITEIMQQKIERQLKRIEEENVKSNN